MKAPRDPGSPAYCFQHPVAMTPIEKIIMRFYGTNIFMFDHEDERHYSSVEKNQVLSTIKAAIMEEQCVDMSGM